MMLSSPGLSEQDTHKSSVSRKSFMRAELAAIQTFIALSITLAANAVRDIVPLNETTAIKRQTELELQKILMKTLNASPSKPPLSESELEEKYSQTVTKLVHEIFLQVNTKTKLRFMATISVKPMQDFSLHDIDNILRSDTPVLCVDAFNQLAQIIEESGPENERALFIFIAKKVNDYLRLHHNAGINLEAASSLAPRFLAVLSQRRARSNHLVQQTVRRF